MKRKNNQCFQVLNFFFLYKSPSWSKHHIKRTFELIHHLLNMLLLKIQHVVCKNVPARCMTMISSCSYLLITRYIGIYICYQKYVNITQYTDMIIFTLVLRYHREGFLFAAPTTISSPVLPGVKLKFFSISKHKN